MSLDQQNLRKTALKAYCRIVDAWELSDQEAARLISIDLKEWDCQNRSQTNDILSKDTSDRISVLIGVYRELNVLFADDMANRWPKLVNNSTLFKGLSPVQAMIEGGMPVMVDTREYVKALVGGG